jgi:hypothetical protein
MPHRLGPLGRQAPADRRAAVRLVLDHLHHRLLPLAAEHHQLLRPAAAGAGARFGPAVRGRVRPRPALVWALGGAAVGARRAASAAVPVARRPPHAPHLSAAETALMSFAVALLDSSCSGLGPAACAAAAAAAAAAPAPGRAPGACWGPTALGASACAVMCSTAAYSSPICVEERRTCARRGGGHPHGAAWRGHARTESQLHACEGSSRHPATPAQQAASTPLHSREPAR